MRISEEPLAPGAQVLTLMIEDHDGIDFQIAVKDVDIAFGIGSDGGDSPEIPAVGHRLGFLSETDIDGILQDSAFMRMPRCRNVEGSGLRLLGDEQADTEECTA